MVASARAELDTEDRGMKSPLTRRGFVGALASATPLALAQHRITANDVVDRIKKKLAGEGVVWGPSAFDGFHLGDPNTTVTGIATTFSPRSVSCSGPRRRVRIWWSATSRLTGMGSIQSSP